MTHMGKWVLGLSVAVWLGCLMSLIAQGNDKDLKTLQGVWKVVKLESLKATPPEDIIQKFRVSFKGSEMTIDTGEGRKDVMKITLDSSKSPAWIDVLAQGRRSGASTSDKEDQDKTPPEKKYKVLGIYKIEDHKLTICLSGPPSEVVAERPKTFEAKKLEGDKEQVIMVLEKE